MLSRTGWCAAPARARRTEVRPGWAAQHEVEQREPGAALRFERGVPGPPFEVLQRFLSDEPRRPQITRIQRHHATVQVDDDPGLAVIRRFTQSALQVSCPRRQGLAAVPAVPGQPPEQLGAQRTGFRGLDHPFQEQPGLGRLRRVEPVRRGQGHPALVGRGPLRRGQRGRELGQVGGDRAGPAPGGRDSRRLQVSRDQLIGPCGAEREMPGSFLRPFRGGRQPRVRGLPVCWISRADDDGADQRMGDEHALARGREQVRGHHVPEILKNAGRIRRAAQDDRQARAVREGRDQEKGPGARRQRADPAGDELAQGGRDVGRPPGEHRLHDPGPPGQFQQEHRVPAGELEQVQQRSPAQPDGGPGGDQVPGRPQAERAEDQPVQPPGWDGIGRESGAAAGPARPD